MHGNPGRVTPLQPRCLQRRSWLAALALLMMLVSPLRADDGTSPLVLGVHPYLSPGVVKQRFQKLADYLEDKTGHSVAVKVGQDYAQHIRAIGQNELDIAYLGPVSYVEMTDQYGVKPILGCLEHGSSKRLSGVLVVHQNSDIARLEDLAGKAFAFGDPHSTMSSRVPRAFLAAHGINESDLGSVKHYPGHTNVSLAVLTGQADAGAVKSEVYARYAKRGLVKLADLPSVPEHLFVLRSNMPSPLQYRLTEVMRNLQGDAEGLQAIQAIHSKATGIAEIEDGDYDPLRSLLSSIGGHGQ